MTDPAPLSTQQIIDAINAAGGSQSTTIGLGKGEKPQGVIQNPLTGGGHPGMAYVPGPETQFGTEVNKNLYQEGEQRKPGGGTQAQIADMQLQLVHAGLLSPNSLRLGLWDAKSQDAYKVVLAYANQHAMAAPDALNVFLANPVPASSTYRAPISITNPADSTAAFDTVSASMTGGGLPASESQDFATYQTGLENQAVSRYTSGKTDKSSSYVGAASPSANAKAYILAHNPQDVVNYDMALRTVQFQNALKEM